MSKADALEKLRELRLRYRTMSETELIKDGRALLKEMEEVVQILNSI